MSETTLTITEALAEIKTINRRLEKKRQFVLDHLFLQGSVKDPLREDGGSPMVIKQVRQSIADLENRILKIRSAINAANQETGLTIGGVTRTISDWLVWRRDVANGHAQFLNSTRNHINSVRQQARQKELTVREGTAEALNEIAVHVNERELAEAIEQHEEILGALDGQLSLLNATVTITV